MASKEFDLKYKHDRFNFKSSGHGMVPFKMLLLRSRYDKCTRPPMLGVMVPSKELELKAVCVRLRHLNNSGHGMVSERVLGLRSRYDKCTRSPISEGMGPCKAIASKVLMSVRLCHLISSKRKLDPLLLRLVPPRSRYDKLTRSLIWGEMVPFNAVILRSMQM